MNGIRDYNVLDTSPLPYNRFTSFHMSQTYDRSTNSYIVTVRVGDTESVSIVNQDPRIFNNIVVYAANRWYQTADATLRNLKYYSYPSQATN